MWAAPIQGSALNMRGVQRGRAPLHLRSLTLLEIGFRATGPTKTATPYLTRLFSGGWPRTADWPAKNVHTDEEFAKATGLSGRNASGAMMQGYLAELMVDMFGEGWLSGGTFSLKFVHQVGMATPSQPRRR